jgi:predicted ArsR family transcriptional regulator
LAQGYIERTAAKMGRGRPSHQYSITSQGRRQAGVNFADLAMALWWEVRAIKDPEVRDEILRSISSRLASMYSEHVDGGSVSERMEAVASMFRQRDIPFEVDHSEGLPVLKALACPYIDLADDDRSICRMERMLFSEMVGASMQSTHCRLDGDRCCAFVAN